MVKPIDFTKPNQRYLEDYTIHAQKDCGISCRWCVCKNWCNGSVRWEKKILSNEVVGKKKEENMR